MVVVVLVVLVVVVEVVGSCTASFEKDIPSSGLGRVPNVMSLVFGVLQVTQAGPAFKTKEPIAGDSKLSFS